MLRPRLPRLEHWATPARRLAVVGVTLAAEILAKYSPKYSFHDTAAVNFTSLYRLRVIIILMAAARATAARRTFFGLR